eukprot:s1358_g5.t1
MYSFYSSSNGSGSRCQSMHHNNDDLDRFDPDSDNYQGFSGPGFDAPMFEGSYNPSYQSGSYDPTDSVGTIGSYDDGYPPEIVSHEVIDEDGPFQKSDPYADFEQPDPKDFHPKEEFIDCTSPKDEDSIKKLEICCHHGSAGCDILAAKKAAKKDAEEKKEEEERKKKEKEENEKKKKEEQEIKEKEEKEKKEREEKEKKEREEKETQEKETKETQEKETKETKQGEEPAPKPATPKKPVSLTPEKKSTPTSTEQEPAEGTKESSKDKSEKPKAKASEKKLKVKKAEAIETTTAIPSTTIRTSTILTTTKHVPWYESQDQVVWPTFNRLKLNFVSQSCDHNSQLGNAAKCTCFTTTIGKDREVQSVSQSCLQHHNSPSKNQNGQIETRHPNSLCCKILFCSGTRILK